MRFDQFITSPNGVPNGVKVTYDKEVFTSMVDFITGLNPNQLDQSQTTKIIDIVGSFNMIPESDEYEVEDTGTSMIESNRSKIRDWYSGFKSQLDTHYEMNKNRRLF